MFPSSQTLWTSSILFADALSMVDSVANLALKMFEDEARDEFPGIKGAESNTLPSRQARFETGR